MKKLLLVIPPAILFAILQYSAKAQVPRPCSYDPGYEVVFFRDDNYQGACVVLGKGNYPSAESAGLPNDWVSSLKPGNRIQVRLFEHSNFEGRSLVVTQDLPSLGNTSFGDNRVSSLKVEPLGSSDCQVQAGTAVFYKDKNFKGPCVALTPGAYFNANDIGLDNNTISSFKVGPGVEVTVYEDEFQLGRYKKFRRSIADLSAEGFNDRASSLHVWKITSNSEEGLPARVTVLPADVDLVKKALGPVASLRRQERSSRNILGIIFDQHEAGAVVPSRSDMQQMMHSVADYFGENSNDRLLLNVVGVMGPYAGNETWADYNYGEQQRDTDGDGFLVSYHKKYKEAIQRASGQFDFSRYDLNGNHVLSADELTIVLLIPGQYSRGFTRPVYERETPSRVYLTVNGVEIRDNIVELYIEPNPKGASIPGNLVHELAHQFLNHTDYYACVNHPAIVSVFSPMDNSGVPAQLDPVAKLKFGWLSPWIISRTGTYRLEAVETGRTAWILMSPEKGNKEYFIVENRSARPNSFDRYLPDSGLAIWHVIEDRDIWQTYGSRANAGNDCNDWGRRGVRLIRNLPPDASALWHGPTRKIADLHWANGQPSGFQIQDFSPAGRFMTAKVVLTEGR